MKVTKQDIDKYFSANYNQLLNDATNVVKYVKTQTTNPETYLSESYFYLMENIDKIPSADAIGSWVYKFCFSEIKWSNGKVNRENKLNNINNEFLEWFEDKDESEGIQEKVNEHQDYITKLAAIEIYKSEASKVDKIVFEVYFNKNKSTVRLMAKHLNIKNTQSWLLIKKMKADINKIYNNLKTK